MDIALQRGVGKVGGRESGISEQKSRKLSTGREGKGGGEKYGGGREGWQKRKEGRKSREKKSKIGRERGCTRILVVLDSKPTSLEAHKLPLFLSLVVSCINTIELILRRSVSEIKAYCSKYSSSLCLLSSSLRSGGLGQSKRSI